MALGPVMTIEQNKKFRAEKIQMKVNEIIINRIDEIVEDIALTSVVDDPYVSILIILEAILPLNVSLNHIKDYATKVTSKQFNIDEYNKRIDEAIEVIVTDGLMNSVHLYYDDIEEDGDLYPIYIGAVNYIAKEIHYVDQAYRYTRPDDFEGTTELSAEDIKAKISSMFNDKLLARKNNK